MYSALNAHQYAETFREFVAGMLSFVYYEVDVTVWNNSWWIFDHHGLVATLQINVALYVTSTLAADSCNGQFDIAILALTCQDIPFFYFHDPLSFPLQ